MTCFQAIFQLNLFHQGKYIKIFIQDWTCFLLPAYCSLVHYNKTWVRFFPLILKTFLRFNFRFQVHQLFPMKNTSSCLKETAEMTFLELTNPPTTFVLKANHNNRPKNSHLRYFLQNIRIIIVSYISMLRFKLKVQIIYKCFFVNPTTHFPIVQRPSAPLCCNIQTKMISLRFQSNQTFQLLSNIYRTSLFTLKNCLTMK